MFSAVSWQQYSTIFFMGLVFYYVFIIIIYYRKELFMFSIPALFRNKSLLLDQRANATTVAAQNSALSSAVHELMEDVNALLRKAEHQQYPKEELLVALRLQLRNYNTIKGTQFQDSIIEHIRLASQTCCNIQFVDAELMQVW